MNIVEKIRELDDKCTVVPDCVWYCDELKPTDIKLYKILLDYGKRIYELEHGKISEEGYPIIDVAQLTLATIAGVSDRTIQTCLSRLQKVKLIRVEGRGVKQTNHITLVNDFYAEELKKLEKEAKPKKEEKGLRVVKKREEQPRLDVVRKPIILTEEQKRDLELRRKLQDMGGLVFSEKKVVDIANHYGMLMCKYTKRAFYRALSKENPQKHKNWKYFLKLHDMCKEKGWDAKLYLEAQFDRAHKYWKESKFRYPQPRVICSENSQKYFERFLKDREEKYSQEAREVNTGAQKTESMRKKFMREIIFSVDLLKIQFQDMTKDERTRQEDKALTFYHGWEGYPASYLYTIPWFHKFIKEIQEVRPDDEKIMDTLRTFEMIEKSKSLKEAVLKTAKIVEEKYNIPDNLAI